MKKLGSISILVITVAGCAAQQDVEEEENVESQSSEDALIVAGMARANRIADVATRLWSGKPSRNLCLAGVQDALQSSGVVSPLFPRLPSAVAFDNWARANPNEVAKRGFVKSNVSIDRIPRGSIITWRPGQCGYHNIYGHVEIVTDNASSRACSDYCGWIKKGCGTPGIYVPAGAAGGSAGPSCKVGADKKLRCDNRKGAKVYATPDEDSEVVDTLRTSNSWFDCWTKGTPHDGGNSTWYHTRGDEKMAAGWVPAQMLQTLPTFDANPSSHGLERCGETK